jgi:glycosyltransferase involved in cell wall biosynthesis
VTSRIAIVVKGYPRLSETFIAQEILGLEQRGLDLLIVSLRHPTESAVHELHRRIRAPVLYLPEYAHDDWRRVLRGALRSLGHPGFLRALGRWLSDLARDPTANRGRRFAQALVLAAELPGDVEQLHVHYLHTPCSVARYAAVIRRLPFSISAHAKDIWTTPDWEKREKLRAAEWVVTCTRLNLDHLRALTPEADIELVHHGLDAARFPAPKRGLGPDGSDPARPVRILCVARAVEKKGLDDLLRALARLPAELHWRFEHIGDGPLSTGLRTLSASLGLDERVSWRGALPQEEVLAALRRADLFCLPARIAADGDRDGLPNVLLEAFSQELAVVTTGISAIPELVENGTTGRLVPPEDPAALAAAILALARSPQERLALGRAERQRVIRDFVMDRGLDRLASRLRRRILPEGAARCVSPSMHP